MSFIKKLKDGLQALILPLVVVIIFCIYSGSWTLVPMWDSQGSMSMSPSWTRSVEPFYDSPRPVTTNTAILSSFNDGNTQTYEYGSGNPATSTDTIVPLPDVLKNSLPPGTMTVIDTPSAVPVSTASAAIPAVPFPTLTGTNVPLVDPAATVLPAQPPNVTNVINNSGNPSSSPIKLPPAVDISPAGNNLGLNSAPPVPVSVYNGTASLPPALAARNNDNSKPYADTDKQSYDLQKYGPLFDELGDVSRNISDNVARLQSVSNKIRTQYVPNFPLPLIEVNAGY